MIVLNNTVYSQKEDIKSKGGKWNGSHWYVPNGVNPVPFADYIDKTTKGIVETVYNGVKQEYAEKLAKLMAENEALKQENQRLSSNAEILNVLSSDGGGVRPPTDEEKANAKIVAERKARNFQNSIDAFLNKSKYERPASFVAGRYEKLGLPSDFVVIDTETTGIGNDDEVVELSVLDSDANELYHSFFKPEKQIVYAASKKTGIYNKYLTTSPQFMDEWPKIAQAIGNRPIAGHNIGFDKRLIRQTLEKQSGKDCGSYCDSLFAGCIDSWKIATDMGAQKGTRSLETLCDTIGVEQPPNHRSSHDCLGVLYVLQHYEQVAQKNSHRRMPNVDDVTESMEHGGLR